jgi:hypothetical protein
MSHVKVGRHLRWENVEKNICGKRKNKRESSMEKIYKNFAILNIYLVSYSRN